jgi:hypothetical protein
MPSELGSTEYFTCLIHIMQIESGPEKTYCESEDDKMDKNFFAFYDQKP